MSVITLFLLSVSMSVDAFAANVAKGAARRAVSLHDMWQTAWVFGLVEMLTLALGYGAGAVAEPHIAAYDHWVAFVLLSVLGAKMLYEAWDDDAADTENTDVPAPSLALMLITAVATGIDSMIMGVSLALMNVPMVWVLVLVGVITAMMSALGLKLGQVLGRKAGRGAEGVGGLVLMAIGVMILLEHLAVI